MKYSRLQAGVLAILLVQNASYTLMRRYSIGVRRDSFSSHECLALAEVFKLVLSLYKIHKDGDWRRGGGDFGKYIRGVLMDSSKMLALAWIYALMNVLSFVSLARIDASTFTIVAQLKILTTGLFSYAVLGKTFSAVKKIALCNLVCGAVLVTAPSLSGGGGGGGGATSAEGGGGGGGAEYFVGLVAVAVEVTLSGFASIYFEKVVKGVGQGNAPLLGIFERNVQLAVHSLPFYMVMIVYSGGGSVGVLGGWNMYGVLLSFLGGGGGILVALSVKHADSVLKTLATSGSIVVATLLGHHLLGGPLNAVMLVGIAVVILAIFLYSFDPTPAAAPPPPKTAGRGGDVEAVPFIEKRVDS